MISYIMMRSLRMVVQLLLISVLAWIIIGLPPGDVLSDRVNRLRESGVNISQEQIARMEQVYGLNKPEYVRYLNWMEGILFHGDLGYSFTWSQPVRQVIVSRIGVTFFIALLAFITTWAIGIPVGIYVSLRQYSLSDYFFTFMSFVGVAVPGFLLALVLMWFTFTKLGIRVGGLFSPEFVAQPWSFARVLDLLGHLWLPLLVMTIGGTAGLIRTMRATMLDELRKQYVMVARAKGLPEWKVILNYPVRIAINPILSTAGWLLVWFFSGGTILEIVLNLNTAGPALYRALTGQDMPTAGAYILIVGFLVSVGSLVSDLLLAVADPRIRFGAKEAV